MLQTLILALLFGGASTAAPVPAPPPPLCRVIAVAQPEQLPGLYTVTVRVTSALNGRPCGVDGYALVQFDGGRQYPVSVVQPEESYVRAGIPWYWRLYWNSATGKRYLVQLLGMRPPFSPSP